MYKSIFLVSLLLFAINAYSQYQQITYNDVLLRKFKVWGIDYHDKAIITRYLKEFDPTFNSYSNNEFEFNKKLNETQNKIDNSIQNIDENKIYYLEFKREFGEYDFTKKQFSFKPFSEVREGVDEDGKLYSFMSMNYGGTYESQTFTCSVLLRDFDFVNGIAMQETVADEFLKQRKYKNSFGYDKINREVFIRVYYVVKNEKSIRNSRYQSNTFKENLKGEPLAVEVWGDKCKVNNLIVTYYPEKDNMSENSYSLLEKLKRDKPKSTDYENQPTSDNFKYLYSWSKLNDKCNREYIELHIKKQHINTEQNILQFRLFTNYNYNINPGFIFNFFNKETNIEFPLVIYEAYVDNGASLLKVKVTDKTLSQIINAECTSIKLQLTGYPKYSIPGGGVMFNKGTDWNGAEIWLYLNEQNKQTLKSTLKQ